VRDFMVVEEHVKGTFGEKIPEEWYEIPVHYKGNPDSILGPDEDVKWPSYTEQLDYELEICAIIGKGGGRYGKKTPPLTSPDTQYSMTGARVTSSFAR
jgi:2-keto-4-pentenoate hydratase/2-oxohepta-3-ene-1,7-dioic acid hydratase in catechol pathway